MNFKPMLGPRHVARAIMRLAPMPCLVLILSHGVAAQVDSSSELFQQLKNLDGVVFGEGFNQCKISEIEPLIMEDLEFYHDQGGVTNSKSSFIKSVRDNICSNPANKPRRTLVEGSLEVYPLHENGILYGAIQKGVHKFHTMEGENPSSNYTVAKFIHLWIKDQGNWKLKRVLSYDHQSKHEQHTVKTVSLSDSVLSKYVGTYNSSNSRESRITKSDEGLTLHSGDLQLQLLPESETRFFIRERPLSFEFMENGAVLLIRENGVLVDEARKED